SQRAAIRPSATASAVAAALTSRLFWKSVQFTSSQENRLQLLRRGVQIVQESVPIHLESRFAGGFRGFRFQRVFPEEAIQDRLALQILEELLRLGGMRCAAQNPERVMNEQALVRERQRHQRHAFPLPAGDI